ncbi:MAG: hypothetical protein JNL61_05005 [Rhizobiaceae bacterium]|nr:hypothetical protein [Rhizobiaceae bacterium]
MNKTIPAEKAKQGRSGRHLLLVLICGLLLAMAAWWGAEFYGALISSGNDNVITSGG